MCLYLEHKIIKCTSEFIPLYKLFMDATGTYSLLEIASEFKVTLYTDHTLNRIE